MSTNFSTVQRIAFVLVVAAIATVGLAAIGGAQTADYSTNDTVELTNDTEPITVTLDWTASISDPANTSATVTFYNETEYASDPANATVALEDTIAADAGNTTTASYDENSSGLELGTEYRVVVTGGSAIDSASIEDSSGLLGAVPGVSDLEGGGVLVGLGVIGAAAIGAAVYVMRD